MADIATAAASGDRRATLEAMRDKLARDMDDSPPAVVAQIAGRLAAILTELDSAPMKEMSTSDDLAGRREARRSAAKMVEATAGAGVKRRGRGG